MLRAQSQKAQTQICPSLPRWPSAGYLASLSHPGLEHQGANDPHLVGLLEDEMTKYMRHSVWLMTYKLSNYVIYDIYIYIYMIHVYEMEGYIKLLVIMSKSRFS